MPPNPRSPTGLRRFCPRTSRSSSTSSESCPARAVRWRGSGARSTAWTATSRGEPRDVAVHAVDRAPDPLHRTARAGQDSELVEELLEVLGQKRLRPVGERGFGGIVDFDHEPVHARAPRRAREARHEIATACSCLLYTSDAA